MTNDKKRQSYPLRFIYDHEKKQTVLPLRFIFKTTDKNNSVTPYISFHDDK